MGVKVLPYKPGSRSARDLARGLGARRLRLRNPRFHRRINQLTCLPFIINWGNSGEFARELYERMARRGAQLKFLNSPDSVELAQDKTETYVRLEAENVPVPEHATNPMTAQMWLDDGDTVLARALTRGSAGRGITLVRPGNPLPRVPLYTKYVKKRNEYRLHFVCGELVDTQHKRRRNGFEEANYQIRNHENGWVFCRQDVAPPTPVCVAAANAISAIGLNFGAVDVGWNEHYQQPVVYEINTAPGLEGTTLTNYINVFRIATNTRRLENAV